MSMSLEQVYFSYEPRKSAPDWTLQEISFTLKPGEFVALAGRSGSGKSTLVQLLKGLLTPTRGHITIGGTDPFATKQLGLFDQVGLVFQYPEHQLFAPSVLADVAFGPRQQRHGQKIDDDALIQQVAWAMSRVGLDLGDWANRHPLELSGGEKRRIALAGVLALRPRLLILDEPTAGLDARGRRHLFDLLHRLNRDEGVTILLVSHRTEEMLAHSSRLLVLDNGRLVADGPPAQVLANEALAAACGLQKPECLDLAERLSANGLLITEQPWDPGATAAQVLNHLHARGAKP